MPLTPTAQQRAVIEHTEGPLLVIAGPGAGKTFTLVERILYLVTDKGVPPEQILVQYLRKKRLPGLLPKFHIACSHAISLSILTKYILAPYIFLVRFHINEHKNEADSFLC